MNEKELRTPGTNFIKTIIDTHNRTGRFDGRVHTRFPPEPNGHLHIGHAKSICLNFGIAEDYHGLCNLRFDDTNPVKEEQEYIDGIIRDVRWLGFDWGDRLYYASDYFETMYRFAVDLIRRGNAFVCDLTAEEVREHRGTLTQPGRESPFRNRSVDENLDLFHRMRAGEFPDGSRTLRAKIDMSAGNLNLRDPVMYRITRATHPRTGDSWCIYPMYDWAHGLEDSIERITHSICTLEFEDHRPLYDWFLDALETYKPQQIEFARLNVTYTVMSKRRLLTLVNEGFVSGWDDPRMPTISGLRRRGYSPESIRIFCDRIGVAKANSTVDYAMLEHCVREHLNLTAARVMVVLDPIKVILTNYPEHQTEMMDADNNPEDASMGKRQIPFSRELLIERSDFMEEPPKKWFRLAPGMEVRLKHGYYITCTDVVRDTAGTITEIHCHYDPESRGGWTRDGRKVRGTLHWVSAAHAIRAEIRLYDHLFALDDPMAVPEGKTFRDFITPQSLTVISNALAEPCLADSAPETRFQFLRHGYFCTDPDSSPGHPVFNRTVGLKDSWAKIQRGADEQ
ncbi:glutamine--tRNA ligase/YqeY domain fusion protein [bacterium]|nr:glutamine--tRNA ligase/YqeY domain fusion protein [candidate division CSSED10-310 bacterium]